jgi:hypothetical protein
MSADPKTVYEQLRRETATMLGFKDADTPSLVQNLQVDCVALLRFSVDNLQGEVFAGKDVDLNKLSTSLGMLKQLLPENSLRAPPSLDEFLPGEAEEIEREWQRKIASLNTERQRRLSEDPIGAMRALKQEIREAQKAFPPKPQRKPWGKPPQAAPASEPAEQQAAPSKQAEQTTARPAQPESDVERMNRVNSRPVPKHYLRSDADVMVAEMGKYFL